MKFFRQLLILLTPFCLIACTSNHASTHANTTERMQTRPFAAPMTQLNTTSNVARR